MKGKLHLLLFLFFIPHKDSIAQVSQEKGSEALSYCQGKKLNCNYALMVDMSKHSGFHRFYVYDFSKGLIIDSSLVSHGCCNNEWSGTNSANKPIFSNKDGSHCTAKGKYEIGKRGYSNWGIHVNYQMHGKESSNNNALARQIVLHSWSMVSEISTYPTGTPEGWGCPAVSDDFMTRLDVLLQKEKNMLLWIY